LRKEHRLRLFENSVLRRIFGPKREEVTTSTVDFITKSFMMGGACGTYRGEKCVQGFGWET
jgi:hypothetical protein